MTKAEKRKARKEAHKAGRPLIGELALSGDRPTGSVEFSESGKGYRARERWARWYDDLNGAPEGFDDR